MNWPRGKHNGKRITGWNIPLCFDVALTDWLPRFECSLGGPYFRWLWFTVRGEVNYHYQD
jgi:hypothetical protein